MPHWISITSDCSQLGQEQTELLLTLMLDAGVHSINNSNPGNIVFYLEEPSQEQLKDIPTLLAQFNISFKLSKVPDENWVQKWFVSWHPLTIDNLQIIPVRDKNDRPVAANTDNKIPIFINPGLGFGTGHHPTTLMLLEMLQSPELLASKPKKVMDLGCGSSILAIACVKLYDSTVDAIDIDDYALQNSADNLILNDIQGYIKLSKQPLSEFSDLYDLIIANLYAELLIEYAALLTVRLKPAAYLLVSGILLDLWPQVKLAFEQQGLILKSYRETLASHPNHQAERDWVAALFQR